MIKVESKFKDFGIQIPTDISEITSEGLDAILTNVVVAKHYCVVALYQNESLFGVINSKVNTVEVMPIIAKISKEDAELIGMKQMDKIIIDRSTLERGYHLYLKHNVLSPQFVNKYITNDTELTRSITVGTFGQNQGYTKGQKVWFVEFKVIAINDLRAAITNNNQTAINPFVYQTKEKAN
ncbi:MAG: hypothetical protein [Bacteriophage sp.]|nr:MAG: hypothetical protein [Bacteriophage sp.]